MRYVEKKKLPFSNAPVDDRNLPDVHLGLYDSVIVFDRVKIFMLVLCFVYNIVCFSLNFGLCTING